MDLLSAIRFVLVLFVLFPSADAGCHDIPLTLNNRIHFPNYLFTATTKYSVDYDAFAARFDNAVAWAPATTTVDSDYLEIDLGVSYKICAVATRGTGKTSNGEYTTQYKFHFSKGNALWNVYKENNATKLFDGNTDTSTAVKHSVSVAARFVRFQPTTYNTFKTLRVEIYGTPEDCAQPFAIGNRGVTDAQMTSSSDLDNSHTASRGRLYGDDSWCSSTSLNSEYLQVDLGQVKTVTGIATQGDKTVDKWVQSYKIRHSQDGNAWSDYTDKQSSIIVLPGNADKSEVRFNSLSSRISARYIRVLARTWNTAICMRIELYGCPDKLNCDNIPLGLESRAIQDAEMTSSSKYNTSYAANNGRLHYTGGPSWCASTSDSSPYLQIDLRSAHVICAVATQGNVLKEQWTTSYVVQGSADGTTFNDYPERGAVRKFLGNFDQHTVVKYSLYQSLVVRYLRFLPMTKYGAFCIRAEIYGTTSSVCQNTAVGIRSSGGIPDYRMTASSEYSSTYAIIYGRLYGTSSWATKTNNDATDYLQIDLGAMHVLCGLATQGSVKSDEWTETYTISYSMDGVTWNAYQENNADKVFAGNTDKTTVVRHTLANPTAAKLIRFSPKTYNQHRKMRVEVYGLRKECRSSLGVERFLGIDPVSQLSSSSQSDAAHSAARGRLYGTSAWCTTNTVDQWLQVDLVSPMSVTGIVTQGDPASSSTKWIQSFNVQFGFSTSKWFLIMGIQGNTDASNIATHWLSKPMGARYVRILPQSWNTAICLRVDVYGCKRVASPDIDSVEAITNQTASPGSIGEIVCSVHALLDVRVTWKQGEINMTSSAQMTYQNGFARSVLRIKFTSADDYAACSRLDPATRPAICSITFTCEAFYDNGMYGPADSKDGRVFVKLNVPSSPTSLAVRNVLDNAASLTWTQPPLTIREATIMVYQFEYHVEGAQQVFQDTAAGDSRSHTIGGLQPITSYVVKVRAVSNVGNSLWVTKRLRTVPTILCQDRALGMEVGSIPNYYITASSQMNDATLPSNARLKKLSGSSWCASTSDSTPYLQIDLGTSHLICAVATQGNQVANQWVMSYSILLSDDGENWKYFQQQDKQKIFSGNTDRSTMNKHILQSRAVGRLVRFIPRIYHGSLCMRVELYGSQAQKECADISVDLASLHNILNHRFTASTTYSNRYFPYKARLGSGFGWASKTLGNPNDYLQVDLGTVYRICAVATLGSGSSTEYVTKYKLILSMDNVKWVVYKVNGNEKLFPGNVNRNILVKNQLNEAASGRFIRFNPTEYSGHKTMRVEVYGVPQDCKEPLGIENLGVENTQMTSSSDLDNSHTALRGRLYGDNSWCSSTSSNSEYLQVDLGQVKTVTGIATQGDKTVDKWVKTYALMYSMDNKDWAGYTAGKTMRKVLSGNRDKSSVAVNWLPYPFHGRYVRVLPLTWNMGACLRFDLYGCSVNCDNLAIGLQRGSIPDSQITASSEHGVSNPARNGRLHYTGGPSWCASTSDSSPYLQIDLGSPHVICAVATQGDHLTDHLVETYQIQGSTDGSAFADYVENSNVKDFAGNFDRKSVVKQVMKDLFIARYVRFLPKSYNILPCMRAEVYGSSKTDCATQPVGQRLGSYVIKDYRITAFTVYSAAFPINSARLYASKAWASKTTGDSNDYLQVDLGTMYSLCAVATQGSPTTDEWVKTYKMSTSSDGNTWGSYSESGSIHTFVGNTNKNSVVKRSITNVVAARFVRIYPVTFNNHKDLRLELYGIKRQYAVPLGLETGSIPDNRLAASSVNSSQIAAHARLYGVSSWCKSLTSSGQSYLQVDLWTVMQISGMATQGNAGNDAWVTSYDLRFSYSTSGWKKRNNFQGNVDKDGLVIQMFNQPINARYLRLLPKSANVLSCLRIEIYGNKLLAKPEILSLTRSKIILSSKGSWVKLLFEVEAQEFVTISCKHNTRRLPGNATYSGGVTLSTLTLDYTNGDDFASSCRRNNLNNQASNCSSVVTCQAFYDYLLTEGSAKRQATVFTEIKVPLAPVNVTFLKIRHYSVQVHWIPGPVTVDRASVRYYFLEYYPDNDPSLVLNTTIRANKRLATIGGLDSNTSYVLQIRAVSIAGEGSWATEKFTITLQVPCRKNSLGMEDMIPDVYITSSSRRDVSSKASLGRLNHLVSWCAATSDSSPYLLVDLGSSYVICAAATQGNPANDQWVTSYEMHYSRDGVNWRPVLERYNIKKFAGNQDRSSVSVQDIPGRPVARSVRIVPTSSQGAVCLRLELYGETYHPGCAGTPIGVQSSSSFPDYRFTASSFFSIDHEPSKARLGGRSSWRPKTDIDSDDYLQIDLGTIHAICVIETDGQSPNDRIQTFVVYYSLDNKDWNVNVDPRGAIKVFSKRKTALEIKISARFVRIFPRTFLGHKSLRVQLYGVAEVCKKSLGIENRGIESNQMTSSSHLDNAHTASRGRLYGNTSWCSIAPSIGEYIEIDLGRVKTIRAVATQGGHVMDKWVKAYTISYSTDGSTYTRYTGGRDTTKVFLGNTDGNSVVVNWLRYPISARHVRILPQDWSSGVCVRLDLYGCQATCSNIPLGLESRAIQDAQMTSSSKYNTSYAANSGRLHYTGGPSWCASTSDSSPYLQIDLGSPHVICAVATQGDHLGDQWVEKYRVMGSLDGITWGHNKEFNANSDRNTKVKHDITVAMTARFVKFLATRSHSNACLRVELYGTTLSSCSKEPIGVRWGGSLRDHRITYSSNYRPESQSNIARLHGPSGWSPSTTTNASDFLQVDLGSVYLLCAVATQGGGERSQWTTSYTVATSLDGSTWETLQNNNVDKVLPGNTDSSSVVKNTFNQVIVAKFARFYPKTYHIYKNLRVEVYGIQQGCRQGLGMENGHIQDSQLSAWSLSSTNLSNPTIARLYSDSAWSSVKPVDSYLQVDMIDARIVTGIATQGRSVTDGWVDSYDVKFGFSTSFWYQIRNFKGNQDGHGVVVNWLARPLGAVFVRIYPTHWKSTPDLRVDVYGCARVSSPRVATLSQDTNLTAITGSAVTLTCSVYGEPFTGMRWLNATSDVTWSSSNPFHSEGHITGNITVVYTSAEMIYDTYQCQRVNVSRSVRCWTTYTCSVYYTGYTNEGMDEQSISVFVHLIISSIYVPSSEYILYAGQTNVTLQCYGHGYPLPKVTWTKHGLPVLANQQIDNKISETNISSRLLLGNESGVLYQEAGNYTCHVVNHVDGQGPIRSRIEVIFAPEVEVTPKQIFSVEGTTVTIHCSTAGVPSPVISWNFNGAALPNNTHINSNSLVIKDIVNTVDNEGEYMCVATSRAGVATSTANLTVWVLPRILQPLKNITLMVGSTLQLSCAVSGEPLPHVTWTKNNVTNLTGVEYSERSTRLVIRNVTVRDEGVYVCNASSKAGWSLSRAVVTIIAAEEVFLSKPYTRTFTKNKTNITADCYGRGYPKPTITWLRNNKTIPSVEYLTSNDTARVVQVIQDGISEPLDNVTSRLYLRTAGILYSDSGYYTCRVSNGVGAIPADKTLEILFVPEFTVLPQDQIVVIGSHVVFTCVASGVPTPQISWFFNNEPTTRNVTNGNLFFTAVHNNRSYEGNYTCVAWSRAGEDRRTVSLFVDELPKVSRIEGPSQIELTTNLTLTCVVTGDPIPYVYWTRNGSRDIPKALFSNSNRTLSIDNVELTVEGVYRCVAWNRAGNDYRDFNLTALAYPTVHVAPPYLRAYLLGQTNISIECKGSGYPTPSVRWKKGDDVIPLVDFRSGNDSDRVVQVPEGDINNPLHNVTSVLYLRTRGIKYRDAGNYTCEVIHSASPDPAHQTVEVLFKPEIVFTSNDEIVLAGNDVTFSCVASGVPEPSIGWMFNSGNVSVPYSTTDSNITIMNVKNNDEYEGNYTCEATSRAGTDRQNIQLEVDVPSRILNITGSTRILVNTAINLTCAVNGDPYPKVFWIKDGSRNVSEALYYHDNKILVVRHAQIKNEGEYRCVAENRGGRDNKTTDVFVLVPPSIYISHRTLAILRKGDVNQSFDCYGNGYPKPAVFWSRSDVTIPFVSEVSSYDTHRVVQVVEDIISQPLQNVTSRLYLRTSGLTYAEAGNYSCQVSNNVSTELRIVEVLFFPLIEVAPSDQLVKEGENVTFICQSSAVPRPSITWLFNGQALPRNHTGTVENHSLKLWNVSNSEEGKYTCLVTSRAGQANYTVHLVVDVPPQVVEVSGNRTYFINTKITLTCHVTGDPVPSVSWIRPGAKPISSNRTLAIDKAGLDDEGEFQCVAVNRAGNTSYKVFITIQALVELYVSPPIRRSYLQRDQNVTVDCFANGYPKPSITWWTNGRRVPKVDDVFPNHTSQVVQVTWDRISGKLQNLTSRLYIRSSGIMLSDAGNYTCNASNGAGTEGLQVQSVEILFRPEIQEAPQDQTVLANTTVTLFCNVTGVPEPTLTWSFTEGRVRSTDVTANNLVIPYVQNTESFEGVYSCNASNSVGLASASARLTIHTVPQITTPLPASMIIERGTTTNLTCQSLADPEPEYRWYKSRRLITQDYQLINGNKTLLLRNVTVKDDARYTCEAYNIEGNATTSTNVTVHAVPVLLQTLPVVSGIIVNKTLQLSCRAESIPLPNVTWIIKGRLVTNDSNGHIVIQTSGTFVKSSTLTINRVRYEDRGTYECVFSNYRGVANTTVILEVYVEPVIIDLTGNSTILSGSKINLTCVVQGDPPPRLLWKKDGSVVPRANLLYNTNSLIIEEAVFGDSGAYQCIAINRAGNDTRTVRMTVLVPSRIHIQPPLTRVYKQQQPNVFIDCYGNGHPQPFVHWSINNTVISIVPYMGPAYSNSTVQVVGHNISYPMDNVTSRLYLRKEGLTLNEAGNYSCSVVNGIGLPSVKTVEVLFFPEFQITPTSKVVLNGSNVLFTCAVSGVPSPVITWYFSGGSLPNPHVVQGSNLLIPDVKNTIDYERNYTCVGASRAGSINYTAQLIVHVPPVLVVSLNDSLVVEKGDWVQLSCKAEGDPEPAYLWTKEGLILTGSKHVRFDDNHQKLTLSNVTTQDNGVYKCLAYNVEGNVSTSTNLTVHATVTMIQSLPARTETLERQAVTLSCKAESIPLPSVTWYRNGHEIQNGADGRRKIQTQSIDSTLTSRISLQSVSYSDRGEYSCVFNNYRGNARSTGRVIVRVPPAILLPPLSISTRLSKKVTFNCTVRGFPMPVITWLKDGVSLSQSGRVNISIIKNNTSIELTSYLSITRSVRRDTGPYSCNATNTVGSTTTVCRLTVLEKPDRPILSVISLTSTTALLQWNNAFDGNSPVKYYTVSYNSSEGTSAVDTTANQPKEHTFRGLLPATQYVFMVISSNEIGTSLAAVSWGTTPESVPWQPKNVYAQSLSSMSVFINWTIPARTNGNLTRYLIFIRPVNQTGESEKNVTVGPSFTHTTIHDLMPYTYYAGEVQGYTRVGGGNRSALFDAVLTFEDLPDVPRRLRVTQSTSTTITLSWARPVNMNGILRAYQIVVRQDMSNATVTLNVTQDIREENVTYTAEGLRPFTTYNITVFAVTIGAGDGSNTIVFSTEEDKPEEPHNIHSTFDGEFYEVTWLPPLTPNGIIIGYIVLFQLDRTATLENDVQDKTFSSEGSTTALKVKLSDLNGDKTYHIKVQGKTSKGYGVISSSYNTIKTPITDPPQPVNPSQTPQVTTSTATIDIPMFSDINGKITFYNVINVVVPKGKQSQLKEPGLYKEEDLVSYCEAHQSEIPAAYVAFIFKSSEYEKHKAFVLGEGQGTKCSMRVARASDTPTYYNGPLKPDTEYNSFSRGYTSEKTFAQTGYFEFTTQRKSPEAPVTGGGDGATMGAAVGAMIAIILILVIVVALYLYRRGRGTPPDEEERYLELNEIKREEDDDLYDNVDAEAPQQRLPIPVENLKSYYLRQHADSNSLFGEEYKAIESPLGVTTTKCDLPINKPKNRYGNIKAYDHSRVVLSDTEPGEDYINANYIDGYNKKDHYIATIGPKQSTCDDFWRMVWEQKSSIIVMLTKPEENGKTKCYQYWPDEESTTFGPVTVKLEEKKELADFEIRTFSLKMLSQPQLKPRTVTHFFFTSWPSHDVPDYATGLLEFWKRVKKYQNVCHENGPMVVHCSAGVGQTGTFIVIDAMMEQIQAEGELDVFSYVTKIRSQRNYMVQKSTQYAFIHYALLEAVTFGHTEIDVQTLWATLAKLEATGLDKQFELLNGVVPDDTYDFVTAVQPHNAKKNRFSNVLPFDRTRVALSAVPGKDDCTYINASYLEGYQEKIGYIATQAPLENTVADLWRMVWENEVYSIVMLCTLEEPTKDPYVNYWPDKDSVIYGTLLVETRSQQEQKDLIIREFNVTNTESGEVRKILHFNYLDWPEHRQPTNLLSLIDLIGALQKARRQHANRPIVVHCSNGIGRTGAFCTLFTSLEKVKLEGYLDVFITARMLRTQRPGMVETLDQYRMCYRAILAYLDSFEESQYQNFM